MSTLSTHILDISTGTPAEGVTVSLSREGETLLLNSGNRGVVCPRRARERLYPGAD